MAVLFIIAKNWKQPRCPSLGECINIHTMTYYAAVKRNELSSYENIWRNLKIQVAKMSEASSKKLHTLWFQLYDLLEKAKL